MRAGAQESREPGAAELRTLYRVARLLLEERDYGELLASLLDATIEAVGAERGFVLVPEDGAYRASAARNFRSDSLAKTEQEVSTTIAAKVLNDGKALLVGDALESFGEAASVQRLTVRSVLCAPLIAREGAFALLYLENRDIANRFSEPQRALLDEICALAAPRLHTAVTMAEAQRRAQEMGALLDASGGLITADARMGAALEVVRQIAPTDLTVLIEGETGTGKELVARAVYRQSRRSQGAFVAVNCAAIPETLIESELFGHMRGAFTGATQDRAGLLAAAHRGTLFLDEIGEMPLELQPRLLRVLQSGSFHRLGSTREETVNVRVIAATNRDLEQAVEEGRFRADLYYRLAGAVVKLPPLRERLHDVRLLTDHFLERAARSLGRPKPELSVEARATLEAYGFPGNVRELEHEMARLVAMGAPGGSIGVDELSERIRSAPGAPKAAAPDLPLPPMPLAEMERRLIAAVLEHTGGNRTRAAEVLGVSREGLRTKMQRLGLTGSGG